MSRAVPLLSVVVPVRDVEPYAVTLLESLCRNSQRDFEFIVVDDGSIDRTPEIVDSYVGRLTRLRVVRQESAVGLADARNVGTALARGRYVTFVDGDDWLAPEYLPRLVRAIQELCCDFVKVDHVRSTGHQRSLVRAPEGRRGVVLDPRECILPSDRATMVDYCTAWAGVYDRRLLDEGLLSFVSGLHTAEDRPWTWRLHLQARSCAVLPLAGYFYRRGLPSSLTEVGDERQLHYLDAFDEVLRLVLTDDEWERFLPKAIRSYVAVIAHHLRQQERLTPALRAEQRKRVRERLLGLPQRPLADLLSVDHPERAALIRGAMAGPGLAGLTDVAGLRGRAGRALRRPVRGAA